MIYHRLMVLVLMFGPHEMEPQPVDPELAFAARQTADVLGMWPMSANWINHTSEIAWMRYRIDQLPVPPPEDLARFPSKDAIAATCVWLMEEINRLDKRPDLLWQDERLEELNRCLLPWQQLSYAHGSSYAPDGGRFYLAKLREMIGPEAYYAGRMPLPRMQPVTLP